MIDNKPLQLVWLKAAVLGSLWASVEIILGSFLHNLRIPFSGSSLAFIAVWLLIAFSQQWKDKGLIWRAGLIAALMKSLSPSAVILGPMIGIFTEALIIDLIIRLLGRNPVAYIIAGALAVLSALVHKVVNLLVLYGFDLVKVLDALFQFAQQTLQLEHIGLKEAFFLLAAIYAVAGAVAALLGYLTGRKISKPAFPDQQELPVLSARTQSLASEKSSELFALSSVEKYATPLLFLNLLAVITALFLISSRFMLPAAIFSIAYLAFCFFRYKRAVNRIRKFSFWLPFMLITLAAAVLLEGIDDGLSFSRDGLIIGIRMNVRAFVILTGFTAISTEMKNPAVKMILYKKGFANLYQALNLSFSALPAILDFISGRKKQKGLHRFSFSRLYQAADVLLCRFQKENKAKTPVIIITGDIGQGKTTFTQKVVNQLQAQNVAVTGFLSLGINEHGTRAGFNLLSLDDGGSGQLCTTQKRPEWLSFGRYFFNPAGLELGDSLLQPEKTAGKDIVVIDEVGPLEINKLGWTRGIERLLAGTALLQCWVVRRSLLQQIARKWDVGTVYVFDITQDSEEDVVKKVKELRGVTRR